MLSFERNLSYEDTSPAFKQSKSHVSQIDRQKNNMSEKHPASSLWFEIRKSSPDEAVFDRMVGAVLAKRRK